MFNDLQSFWTISLTIFRHASTDFLSTTSGVSPISTLVLWKDARGVPVWMLGRRSYEAYWWFLPLNCCLVEVLQIHEVVFFKLTFHCRLSVFENPPWGSFEKRLLSSCRENASVLLKALIQCIHHHVPHRLECFCSSEKYPLKILANCNVDSDFLPCFICCNSIVDDEMELWKPHPLFLSSVGKHTLPYLPVKC